MTPVSGVIFSISIALGVHWTTFYTNLPRIFAASQDYSWLHGPWKGAEGKLMNKINYKNRYFPIWDYASAEVIFAPAETSAVALGGPTRYRITPLLKRVATL